MTKRELIDDQNSCLNKAADDEPIFVLLGRDAAAYRSVLHWAQQRVGLGMNGAGDSKIANAISVARQMRAYHDSHR